LLRWQTTPQRILSDDTFELIALIPSVIQPRIGLLVRATGGPAFRIVLIRELAIVENAVSEPEPLRS
jgi:hypothetical protein